MYDGDAFKKKTQMLTGVHLKCPLHLPYVKPYLNGLKIFCKIFQY